MYLCVARHMSIFKCGGVREERAQLVPIAFGGFCSDYRVASQISLLCSFSFVMEHSRRW